jgi:hypothetical protein
MFRLVRENDCDFDWKDVRSKSAMTTDTAITSKLDNKR